MQLPTDQQSYLGLPVAELIVAATDFALATIPPTSSTATVEPVFAFLLLPDGSR
jgi:hypothetical protein